MVQFKNSYIQPHKDTINNYLFVLVAPKLDTSVSPVIVRENASATISNK